MAKIAHAIKDLIPSPSAAHEVYVGIGSNLGDRQANILSALQRLRRLGDVVEVSEFYESTPADAATGPKYLNVAAFLRTELDKKAFNTAAQSVEVQIGRVYRQRLLPRPIDIDLLFFDGEQVQPLLSERLYNAIPLYEIAPDLLPRPTRNGVARVDRSLHFSVDRQEEEPTVALALNRVGVSGIRRTVHIPVSGQIRQFSADVSMAADLAVDKAGVHMSRFSEMLEEAALDSLSLEREPAGLEQIAVELARGVVQSQRAFRAEITLTGKIALERWTPVSGKRTEETYTVIAMAHADEQGVRRVIGIEADGMTACPCAQAMMREHYLHELLQAGLDEHAAERALDVLPIATHNQRGRATLLIGLKENESALIRPEDLIEIVENAMSSETYDLLKRPDELFVVKKAHANPKFVEDVVRGVLAGVLDMYQDLGDDSFVLGRQINYESIHKHDAFAEAFGTLGDFRNELGHDLRSRRRIDLGSWLSGP